MSDAEVDSPTGPGTNRHPEVTPIVEIEPSSERAAQRIAAWYNQLEPRLGIYLTDPNVVLTLADARGQTEFFVESPSKGDSTAIESLNAESMQQGVRFTVQPGTSASTGAESLMVNVENLAGIQNTSSATKLPGIPRFESSAGWDGYELWKQDTISGIRAAQESGYYPKDIPINTVLNYAFVGVVKGYPDTAIMAAMTEPVPAMGEVSELVRTNVPYSDYYHGAEPNFSYHPKDQATVDRTIQSWGHILEGYYKSAAHQQLEEDENFRHARLAES